MKQILSYLTAIAIGLLCVAPPIPYDIPLLINSFSWVYLVIVAGLFGFFTLSRDVHWTFKVLMIGLFVQCFFSMMPVYSFNAYILLVATLYFFLACKKIDFKPVLQMAEAVFWIEVVISIVQVTGHDHLMSFPRSAAYEALGVPYQELQKHVYFGTVFQQMRFASLLCILSPLLLLKSKWYVFPILFMAYLLGALGFSLAIAAGVVVYLLCEAVKRGKFGWVLGMGVFIIYGVIIFGVICVVRSFSHIRVEIVEGRVPIWLLTIKTMLLDTTAVPMVQHKDIFGISQTGPVDWKHFFIGHGLDTYLQIFKFYKHDANPFPNAHNDWLQLPWEIGIVMTGFFWVYCGWVVKKLWEIEESILLAGLVIIAFNMFFAFPWRMTQTVLPMVAFLAYCETRISIERVFL